MGMFDDLRCEFELPIKEFQDTEFQTKDFECTLAKIKIKRDGTLWTKGGICAETDGWQPIKHFTGELRFYTTIGSNDKENGIRCGWIEFSSYFKDSKLKELNLVQHRERGPCDKSFSST